jgi:hypothetical protein
MKHLKYYEWKNKEENIIELESEKKNPSLQTNVGGMP